LLGLTTIGGIMAIATITGCRQRPVPPKETPPVTVVAPAPVVSKETVRIQRETEARESSGLVAGRIAEARRAFVADEDDKAIVELDLETNTVARSTPIDARPRDLLLLADGTLAATLPDTNAIAVFAREVDGGLREVRRVKTPVEPMAMALSPDDTELFVSTGVSHSLVRLSASALEERGRWSLGREPRGVLVSDDGKRVFVSHATDTVVSVVQLAQSEGEVLRRDIGHRQFCITTLGDEPGCFPQRHARNAQMLVRLGSEVIVPAAQVMPNPPSSPLSGASGYGIGSESGGAPITMDLATLDAGEGADIKTRGMHNVTTCLLPRAAVVVDGRVIVACLGSSRIEQYGAPAKSSFTAAAFLAATQVGGGPTALAAERDGASVLVWSSFARQLARVATSIKPERAKALTKHVDLRPRLARLPSVKIGVPHVVTREPAWLRGRELFFANEDPRISRDNRACASCHVDGRDDGLTWQTPMGPRRTRVLAGQLDAAPYGWRGEHSTLEDHVKVTFRQLQGTGLPSSEVEALLTYVRSLPKPPRPTQAEEARGKELFAAAECGNCHGGNAGDRTVHDVGTGAAFMTPTLAGIGMRRELMHDGRYANLDDLIAKSKAMGTGSSLSAEDRHALVGYLETL
jgi:hypothetical protein